MVKPQKISAYALSDQDKRKLQDLLNKLDPPAPTDDTRETIWLRVKTGTTIEPMSGPDGNLVPGQGIGVQWRQSQRINGGVNQPLLTKNDRDANSISSEGQDYSSAVGDLEYNVYNYTPFELFECSWFCAELSKRGQWVVNAPPMPIYFARSSSEVPTAGVGDAELGALDYDVIAAGDNPVPSYFSGITRPVYNPGAAIDANTPFLVSQEPGGKFVVLGGGSGGGGPARRLKFKLVGKLRTSSQENWADAEVIDPMTSGVTIGSTIKVRDPKKQFQFAGNECMGIAYFSAEDAVYSEGPNPPDIYTSQDGGQWIIEQCDQYVTRYSATMTGGVVGWESQPGAEANIAVDEPTSYWPYIHRHPDDVEVNGKVFNSEHFTANPGKLTLERRVVDLDDPQPTYTETPTIVGSSEVEWEWHIVDVEKPTARYAGSALSGDEFTIPAVTNWYEGYPADENPAMNGLGGRQVDEFDPLPCALDDGTKGIAFLDDTEGEYRTFATMSAMYGEAKRIDVVAASDDVASPNSLSPSPIGTDNTSECGTFKYDLLKNVHVFGSTDSSSTCRMEYQDPQPEVDTNANAVDVTVITGVSTNASGEIVLTSETIKACPTPGSDIPLPYSTTDVVDDVYCDGDSLTKSYKQIKYIGNDVPGSSNSVSLPCTDPANYDWEVIFNNYVYNEDWWNVSYYDITWPEGCEPCPDTLGCCSYTNEFGNPEQAMMTEAACNLESQSTWDGTVTSCDGGGGGCDNIEITNFQMNGLQNAGSGGCDASFSQTGGAVLFTGGSATIPVAWSGYNGFPQTGTGSITLTHDGTNWNWDGDIAWLPSVNVTGTASAPGCGSAGGGAISSGGGSFPCDGTWANGTWSFTATQV